MESRAGGGGSSSRRPPPHEVKVKHIITREMSTDEANFKDVVLRLTGKDSAAARMELLRSCDDSPIPRTTAAPVVSMAMGGSSRSNAGVEGSGAAAAGFNMGTAVSCQDTVLPSLEEMDRWWGSHGVDSYPERP